MHVYTHLLLRASLTRDAACQQLRELVDRCNLLINASIDGRQLSDEGEQKIEQKFAKTTCVSHVHLRTYLLDMQNYAPIAKELIEFWPQVPPTASTSKDKAGVDAIVRTLTEWLYEHPESALVLLFLHVAMSVLGKAAPELGLRLLDSAILAYFQRESRPQMLHDAVNCVCAGRLTCDWRELSRWLVIPSNSNEYLYTSSTSEAAGPPLLTLNAHLYSEMSHFTSAKAEIKTMLRLGDYLQSLKPK